MGPLNALYTHHKDAVRGGLKQMLEQKRAYTAQLAARGLEALIPRDASLASFLVPELVAKLARANRLLEGLDDEIEDALGDIRNVLVQSFKVDPAKTDQMVQDFFSAQAMKARRNSTRFTMRFCATCGLAMTSQRLPRTG
jgi:hypothetical protein